jgi:hypothetical protein
MAIDFIRQFFQANEYAFVKNGGPRSNPEQTAFITSLAKVQTYLVADHGTVKTNVFTLSILKLITCNQIQACAILARTFHKLPVRLPVQPYDVIIGVKYGR